MALAGLATPSDHWSVTSDCGGGGLADGQIQCRLIDLCSMKSEGYFGDYNAYFIEWFPYLKMTQISCHKIKKT